MENTFTVRVPLLGITFDVNDLAPLGGFSLVVLLVWFHFSVARERDNLIIAFNEALKFGELPAMYHLLAMRQVLTIPPVTDKPPVLGMVLLPKALLLLPATILTTIFLHDMTTPRIAPMLNEAHSRANTIGSLISWIVVVILTATSIAALRKIDTIWSEYWDRTRLDESLTAALTNPRIEDTCGDDECRD